jgi:hypothetical protein
MWTMNATYLLLLAKRRRATSFSFWQIIIQIQKKNEKRDKRHLASCAPSYVTGMDQDVVIETQASISPDYAGNKRGALFMCISLRHTHPIAIQNIHNDKN